MEGIIWYNLLTTENFGSYNELDECSTNSLGYPGKWTVKMRVWWHCCCLFVVVTLFVKVVVVVFLVVVAIISIITVVVTIVFILNLEQCCFRIMLSDCFLFYIKMLDINVKKLCTEIGISLRLGWCRKQFLKSLHKSRTLKYQIGLSECIDCDNHTYGLHCNLLVFSCYVVITIYLYMWWRLPCVECL